MKKLLISAGLALATASSAHAYRLAVEENGVLVPHVVHNGAADTTVVGLTSKEAGTVYWTFFDVNSNHVTDGQFDVTAHDLAAFNWYEMAGDGTAGIDGYLVFVLDTNKDGRIDSRDADVLAGNALQVDLSAQDVVYVPVHPLAYYDFYSEEEDEWLISDPTTLNADSLVHLHYGTYEGVTMNLRYFIDGAPGGTDTAILIWTAQDASGTYTVNMFDDAQNRKSVNFVLPNAELNIFDPESIVGRPASFLDGFIAWQVPDFGDVIDGYNVLDSVFSYSVIAAPAFGARQTLLNTHTWTYDFYGYVPF